MYRIKNWGSEKERKKAADGPDNARWVISPGRGEADGVIYNKNEESKLDCVLLWQRTLYGQEDNLF